MGLANLAPGVSGGTMLLVAGVYDRFIEAVAKLAQLRFDRRSVALVGLVAGTAGTAILLFAGPMKQLVVEKRWLAYALFLGLTLGGAPVVVRLARPLRPAFAAGTAVGLAAMLALTLLGDAGRASAEPSWWLFLLAGVVGAAAMILPGVSGGYLLLLMGAYVPILAAIDRFKEALAGRSLAEIAQAGLALAPVGVGVAVGVAGVASALRTAIRRFPQATHGLLLGLLLGAIAGLWPFQQARAPTPGEVVKGVVVTAHNAQDFPVEDWPVAFFTPTPSQALWALVIVAAGTAFALGLDRWAERLEGRSSRGG